VVVVVVVVVGLIDGSQEDYVGFKCSRRKTFYIPGLPKITKKGQRFNVTWN